MNVHVIEEMSDGARGPASVLVVVRGGRGRARGRKNLRSRSRRGRGDLSSCSRQGRRRSATPVTTMTRWPTDAVRTRRGCGAPRFGATVCALGAVPVAVEASRRGDRGGPGGLNGVLAGGVGEGGSDGCEWPAADCRHGPDGLVAGPQGACADRGAARRRTREAGGVGDSAARR